MSLADIIAKNAKTTPAAGATSTPAQAALGGGSRLATVKAALMKAKSFGGRNDMPVGTAQFLLKNAVYEETQMHNKMTKFSLLCINPIKDNEGLAPTSPSYTGPRKWEEYEIAVFHEGKYLESEMAQNLQILATCCGWSEEYKRKLQATDAGLNVILELSKGLFCRSLDGLPSNQPCAFANQVVVEITAKPTPEKQKKDATTKQLMFDAQGQPIMTKSYINKYWNKRIPLADVVATLGEADTLRAFGSQQAFELAYQTEVAMDESNSQPIA